MKEIILSSGHIAFTSDEDYEYINQFNWRIGTWGYATRSEYINKSCKTIMMHIEIVKRIGLIIPFDMEPDYKDRNKLNNQRENLRIVTKSINKHNRGLNSNNTTGVKGVSFDISRDKWKAQIDINGTHITLGRFSSFEEAVEARLKAEKKYKRIINPE